MKKSSSAASQKAFLTIFAMLYLNAILLSCSVMLCIAKNYALAKQEDTLDYVELAAIHKVVIDLENYEEEDETYDYLNYTVNLDYDDITCIITIKKNNEVVLKSKLVYDDIDLEVDSYAYLSD